MKYVVDDWKEFTDVDDVVEYIVNANEPSTDDFDQYLNEVFGNVEIAGYEYCTSYALKNIDETAYDEEYANWSSKRKEEIASEIERDIKYLNDEDEYEYGRTFVVAHDDEDEEVEE